MATQASTMCTVPETILATLIRTSMSCWFSNAISALVSVEQVHVDTNDGTVTIDTSQLDSAKWQQLMCLIPPSGPLLFADGVAITNVSKYGPDIVQYKYHLFNQSGDAVEHVDEEVCDVPTLPNQLVAVLDESNAGSPKVYLSKIVRNTLLNEHRTAVLSQVEQLLTVLLDDEGYKKNKFSSRPFKVYITEVRQTQKIALRFEFSHIDHRNHTLAILSKKFKHLMIKNGRPPAYSKSTLLGFSVKDTNTYSETDHRAIDDIVKAMELMKKFIRKNRAEAIVNHLTICQSHITVRMMYKQPKDSVEALKQCVELLLRDIDVELTWITMSSKTDVLAVYVSILKGIKAELTKTTDVKNYYEINVDH